MYDFWLWDNNGCASPVTIVEATDEGFSVQIKGINKIVFWSHDNVKMWMAQGRVAVWYDYRDI